MANLQPVLHHKAPTLKQGYVPLGGSPVNAHGAGAASRGHLSQFCMQAT